MIPVGFVRGMVCHCGFTPLNAIDVKAHRHKSQYSYPDGEVVAEFVLQGDAELILRKPAEKPIDAETLKAWAEHTHDPDAARYGITRCGYPTTCHQRADLARTLLAAVRVNELSESALAEAKAEIATLEAELSTTAARTRTEWERAEAAEARVRTLEGGTPK